MKKTTERWMALLLLLVPILCNYSCAKEKVVDIRISSATCTFGADGGTREIAIASSGVVWTAQLNGEDVDWFTMREEDDKIVITAPSNMTESAKHASVVITAGKADMEIRIVQNGSVATNLSILPDVSDIAFDNDGGEYTLTVASNNAWSVTGRATWLTISTDTEASTLTFSAQTNNGDEPRTGIISIESGDKSITLNVTQYTIAEHPYYSLCGEWSVYSDKWVYRGEYIDDAGNYTSCRLEPDKVNNTYIMRDFILEGIELGIDFDHNDNSIGIPLGYQVGQSWDYIYFLMQVNMVTLDAKAGYVYGEVSEDRNSITLKGIDNDFGLGVVALYQGQLAYVYEAWYPIGETIRFERKTSSDAFSSGSGCIAYKSNAGDTYAIKPQLNNGKIMNYE